MNKYELLFNDIFKKTKDGELSWKQIKKTRYSGVIFNPNMVFRQFETEYSKNHEEYTILLVEKKFEDPNFDFAYDKYSVELLILEGAELVATITDSVVERSKFISLTSLVESKSDKAKKLFE